MDPATAPRHIDVPEGRRHVGVRKRQKGSCERGKAKKMRGREIATSRPPFWRMDPATAPRHIDVPEGRRHVGVRKRKKGSCERVKKTRK
jgi:hypothetical protein